MARTLLDLPVRDDDGNVHAVIEAPQGSRVKLKYEPALGAFRLSRPLTAGLAYPYDWGFIPSTRSPDDDPLDVLVIHDAPTYPGVVIPCRPIAVLELTQKKKGGRGRERNDRVLAVPVRAARGHALRNLADLSERLRDEIAEFFLAATRFENKDARIVGWGDAQSAERQVDESAERYQRHAYD